MRERTVWDRKRALSHLLGDTIASTVVWDYIAYMRRNAMADAPPKPIYSEIQCARGSAGSKESISGCWNANPTGGKNDEEPRSYFPAWGECSATSEEYLSQKGQEVQERDIARIWALADLKKLGYMTTPVIVMTFVILDSTQRRLLSASELDYSQWNWSGWQLHTRANKIGPSGPISRVKTSLWIKNGCQDR